MLETQQINQAIAEALTWVGLDEKLAWGTELLCECGNPFHKPCRGCSVNHVPHDFTDPRYLFPALEALRYDVEWCPFENETERGWNVEISNATTIFGVASEPTLAVALRNAFAAALGVNI